MNTEPKFTTQPPLPIYRTLDHCITDARIDILDTVDDKIRTSEDFDSDHRALIFTIETTNWNIETTTPKYRHMYKKTKWKKFTKHLEKSAPLNIPHDRNLTNDETDTFINNWTQQITDSIEATVPKYTPITNSLLYTNSKIKKLKKK